MSAPIFVCDRVLQNLTRRRLLTLITALPSRLNSTSSTALPATRRDLAWLAVQAALAPVGEQAHQPHPDQARPDPVRRRPPPGAGRARLPGLLIEPAGGVENEGDRLPERAA